MRAPSRSSALRAAVLVGLLAVAACSDSRTRLPFSSAQVPGLIEGPANIGLTVRETTGQLVAVLVEVSNDNQLTFKQATPVPGAAPTPMFAASSAGTTVFFRWDPIQDLGPGIHRNVVVRVNSAGRDVGQPVTVTGITVDLSDRLDPAPAGPVLVRPSAIALADGSVWIVGGTQPNGSFGGSATRFDPVTGLFTPTPGLTEARTGLGLALLLGGDVLVAGGTAPGGGVRPTAELYRFEGLGTGQVIPAASLQVARDGAAVAALQDGRAVVIGGRGAGGAPVAEVELFTPGTGGGAFSVAFTDPRAARLGATATLLADGRVLVLGGVDGAGVPVTEALLLDATATAFTSAGSSQGRAEHAAVRLPDGRVLAVGGTSVFGDPAFALSSADLFDPAQNKFGFVPPMARARHRPGLAYAGGYAVAVGDQGTLSIAERFDPDALVWTPIAGQSTLARPDAVAVATGPGRAVVVGGGVATELYTPDAAVGAEPFDEVRSVPQARADHSATSLPDGSVLIVGGTSRAARALASVERFEPNPRLFSPRAPLLRARADHAATNIGQGLVLVVGGRDGQGAVVPDAELYDPSIDRWVTAGTLQTPRAGATAVLLGDGSVLVSGGVDAAGVQLASQEVWSPTTQTFSPGPALSEARTDHEAVEYAGSVLVGPGQGTSGATGNADFMIPVGTLTARTVTSVGARGRAGLSAPPAGGGLILAVGGEDGTGTLRADIGFVDLRVSPAVWLATTRPLLVARASPRLTPLGNGLDVLVTGGRGQNAPALDAAELYVVAGQPSVDLGTSRRTNDPRQVKARSRHTATALPDGRLLVVGGFDERGVAIAGAELWRR